MSWWQKCEDNSEVRKSSITTVDNVESAYRRDNNAQDALRVWHQELNSYYQKSGCPNDNYTSRLASDSSLLSKNGTGLLPVLEIEELKETVAKRGHGSGAAKQLTVAELTDIAYKSDRLTSELILHGLKHATTKSNSVTVGSLSRDLENEKRKAAKNDAKGMDHY